VNKNKFLELIRGYPSLSEKDLGEIDEITLTYPYVQIGHALSAKANQNIHSSKAGIKLKYAAVYTAERSVLRSLIENKIELGVALPAPEKAEIKLEPDVEPEEPKQKEPTIEPPVPKDKDQHREMMEGLYAEMESNLQQLQKYKFQFFEQNPELFKEELKKKNPNQPEVAPAKKEIAKPEDLPEPQEDYLANIDVKDSNDKSESKLTEQIKIIDDFIEASSKLANLPPPVEDSSKEDLSKPSTTLGDDLISENLANILIKQGKINDAIDIYKKLIWKFPQKQAYFAARIEELKKN